jgi:hypothetical protein
MLNRKAIVRHERNNASAAAEILRNRASQSLVMILWAEAFQRRQRAENAEPATTAPPVQRPLPLLARMARSESAMNERGLQCR